jgi:hypothetical protein
MAELRGVEYRQLQAAYIKIKFRESKNENEVDRNCGTPRANIVASMRDARAIFASPAHTRRRRRHRFSE